MAPRPQGAPLTWSCPDCPSPGLCVATPARLRVFREFHLHVRLPASIRRFEQLELRPVLYNYLEENLTVSPGHSAGVAHGWAPLTLPFCPPR